MLSDYLSKTQTGSLQKKLQTTDSHAVEAVLCKSAFRFEDLPLLLSPAAEPFLRNMGDLAESITRRRFGNIIQLYVPLYLSNKCRGNCVYCGFRNANPIRRKTLSVPEVLEEAEHLHNMGFRNLLLVAGETPDLFNGDYLPGLIARLSESFTAVSVEIQPLEEPQYRELVENNLDGVTLYQETYNSGVYEQVHPGGEKNNFEFRLDAMDRIGKAGVRRLGIGALLGLDDFRREALFLGIHCRYLIRHYWQSAVSVSFPRIRENESNYRAPHPVSDRQMAQMVFAFRMVFPDVDLVLSTREPPSLRDLLAARGITYMSAGSRTHPGGYALDSTAGQQFELEDRRSVAEVCNSLRNRGLDVVWKDWYTYA